QPPHPWHSRAGGGAVHSISSGLMQRSTEHPYSMTSLAERAASWAVLGRVLKVRKSIDLDVRSIHDSCPFLRLCSDDGREVLGRAHLGFRAKLGEDRSHLLGFHNRVNFGVEPVDNRCGGCSGCEDG